jgi:hypothetical protein
MYYVPDAVNELDLVSDKLDREQDQGDTNHPPVRHDFKFTREFQMCKAAQQTQRRYSRVQIDTRNPGGAHANCQCGNEVHWEDYTTAVGVKFASSWDCPLVKPEQACLSAGLSPESTGMNVNHELEANTL